MRPRSSLRSIVVVVALVAVAVCGSWWWAAGVPAPSPAGPGRSGPAPAQAAASSVSVSVEEAVRRTLAAGSAEVALTVGAVGGGRPPVEVAGVVSLVSSDAAVTASMAGVGEVEVRVRAGEAWVRVGGGPWQPVDPSALTLAGTARGWDDLLGGLRPVAGRVAGRVVAGQPSPATSKGRPARVEVDGAGRITRLVVDEGPATLDLRLRAHGVAVDVDPPP